MLVNIFKRYAILLGLFILLTACGGGGDPAPASTPAPTPAPTPAIELAADLTTENINKFINWIEASLFFGVSTEVGTNFNDTYPLPGKMTAEKSGCLAGSAIFSFDIDASDNVSGTGDYKDYDDCAGRVLNGSATVNGVVNRGVVDYLTFTFTDLQIHRTFNVDVDYYKVSGSFKFDFNANLGAGHRYVTTINASFFDVNGVLLFKLEDFVVNSHMTAGQESIFISGRITDVDEGYVDIMNPTAIKFSIPSENIGTWSGIINGATQQAKVDAIGGGATTINIQMKPVSNNPIDSTFGISGLASMNVSPTGGSVNDLVKLSDGSLLVVGNVSLNIPGSNSTEYGMAKFSEEGVADISFGTNGLAVSEFGVLNGYKMVAAEQPSGKILLARTSQASKDFEVVRFNADGSLDLPFGTGGVVITSFGSRTAQVYDITVLTDGKFIVSGNYFDGVRENFAVARYNVDGTLDLSLNSTGKLLTQVTTGFVFNNSVIAQADGKILVSGTETSPSAGFVLVRYNNNGSLDTDFGTLGFVRAPQTTVNANGAYATQLSNGKYIVAGLLSDGTGNTFTVARYNTNGTLDIDFGTSGVASHLVNGGSIGVAQVTLQSDGKIIVVGTTPYGAYDHLTLVRFNSDGTLDETFGIGGSILSKVGLNGSNGNSLVVQPDNKIVAAATIKNTTNEFGLIRYLP